MTTWLSKRAVLWALDEAPDVPADLVSTLIAVARYAGEDGCGSYPSAQTIAMCTRKSKRQAQRDLDKLEQLGLLGPGDKRLVKDLPANRRPNVYDVAMPRGDTHDTPETVRGDTHDTPQTGPGVTSRALRGDIHVLTGTTPMSPKEVPKTSGSRARANGAAAPRDPVAPMRECTDCGAPGRSLRRAAGKLWCGDCLDGYIKTASIEQLRAEHLEAIALGRGLRDPAEFGYARAASP